MRILFLSNANSAHTIKWVSALADKGLDLTLFSFAKLNHSEFQKYTNVQVFTSEIDDEITQGKNELKKLFNYRKTVRQIEKIIADARPDIVHAHYLSSYGFVASLAGFHPLVVSVWGTDVLIFPRKSFIHKLIIKRTLKRSDLITSTSNFMAAEVRKYTSHRVEVIPFGVDTKKFSPDRKTTITANDTLVIGTIKSLEKIYGIDVLIRAFALLKSRSSKKIELLIAGGGTEKNSLKKLAGELNISEDVIFTDKIAFEKIPLYHQSIDIFISPSRQESFGVSLVEAMSCGRPIIASDIPAFKEVAGENGAAIFFKPGDEKDLADKILSLINNPDEIKKMGSTARLRAEKEFNWDNCADKMIQLYSSLI